MKALYFEQHGELDVVKYGDVPDPEPGRGEVLIRVRACALNFLDIWVRRGWPGLHLEMPHWCGADVAGEIAAIGTDVSDWQVGQRVVVDPGISSSEDEYTRRGEDSVSADYHILGEHVRGGAAEYLKVPVGNLAAMPAHALYTRVEWRIAALDGVRRHCARGQCGGKNMFRTEDGGKRQRR